MARERAPIERFRLEELPHAFARPNVTDRACDAGGAELEWNSHWGGQNLHFVLRSSFTVKRPWLTPALHLRLGVAGDIFTHPEALAYIDGVPLASADRHYPTIDLPPKLADGQANDLYLHGWAGLTGWPPDPNDRARLFLGTCAAVDPDRDLQHFITPAEAALDLSSRLDGQRTEKHAILSALDAAFLTFDTRDPMEGAFRASVAPATALPEEGLRTAGPPIDVTLHGIGHAHREVAYLWPIAQIRAKNARTYSNVLRLMERHREFRYSHSQPQLHAWTETDDPEPFEGIRAPVCTLQFHDILTGTSGPEVFADAARDYEVIAEMAEAALARAAGAVMRAGAACLVLDGAPLAGPCLSLLPEGAGAVAEDGLALPAQPVADGVLEELPAREGPSVRILEPAEAAPEVGEGGTAAMTEGGGAVLENAHLTVEIGPHGMLPRIFGTRAGRQVLEEGQLGTKLELFEDRPVSWDAWDIDIFFEDRGELVGGLTGLRLVETGPLRAKVELTRSFRQSHLTQRISLTRNSARIEVDTEVDWHETHLLLKAAFPVSVRAARAGSDIQWGQIDRPTHRNTSRDVAQFEVPEQKWAHLGEEDYGVALLNDCKYGYDVRDG